MKRSNFYNVLNGTREPTLGELLAMVQEFELRSIEELIAPFGTSELRSLDFGFEDP